MISIKRAFSKFLERALYSSYNANRLRYPRVSSIESFLERNICVSEIQHYQNAVDLGSGPLPANPLKVPSVIAIDIGSHASKCAIRADLSVERIPLTDAAVDVVTCFDFLEHIPRVTIGGEPVYRTRFPFVELMSEIYRVLSTGGLMISKTPAFPFKAAFQDPTHVNIITEDTFPLYFCALQNHRPIAEMYGFNGGFEFIAQSWMGHHLITALRKP